MIEKAPSNTSLYAYRYYLSLKLHFSPQIKYDFFKHGVKKIAEKTFGTRKDVYHFYKLSKIPHWEDFLLANFSKGHYNVWIGNLITQSLYHDVYNKWNAFQQSYSYKLLEETKWLYENYGKLRFSIMVENQSATILQLFLREKVSLDCLCFLDSVTNCFSYWDREIKTNPVFDDLNKLCLAYKPFIKNDTKIIQNDIKKYL